MIFRVILKILCYVSILAATGILVISSNLDVKFGFDSYGENDQFQNAYILLSRVELHATIIALATFGLILLDIFKKKK